MNFNDINYTGKRLLDKEFKIKFKTGLTGGHQHPSSLVPSKTYHCLIIRLITILTFLVKSDQPHFDVLFLVFTNQLITKHVMYFQDMHLTKTTQNHQNHKKTSSNSKDFDYFRKWNIVRSFDFFSVTTNHDCGDCFCCCDFHFRTCLQ